MMVKGLERRGVDFCTTSPVLTDACRFAVKRDHDLARHANIRELTDAAAICDLGKQAHEFQMVVLSHAEEEPRLLIDSRREPVVSEAFHVLFTGPTTHPDQVAQWMRSTNIRSENRLHVVQMNNMKAPTLSQLLRRICSAFGPDASRPSIVDAYMVGERLFVRGPKHRMLHVPISALCVLNGQTREIVRNFTVDPDGSFLFWPDLDAHLGWNQLLQALDPAELRKAQQRSTGFNKQYGAAIRKVRVATGILQSKVNGLTERQLRRIERGESRATSAAITALATAHGMDANAYMDRLTKAMP